ncbi:hypothetical protein Tcan_04371 [Toxocara canis]|uniref:Transmembrane protein n=1 Tax=Toxocara canis TaxID=6265 RepID=A0A0B2V8A5_TOXCA|nr:hypothetical protein Tcan_04371 [Toxocara canis]
MDVASRLLLVIISVAIFMAGPPSMTSTTLCEAQSGKSVTSKAKEAHAGQLKHKNDRLSSYANVRKLFAEKQRKLDANKEIRKLAVKRNKATIVAVLAIFIIISVLWIAWNCLSYCRKMKEFVDLQTKEETMMAEQADDWRSQ